MKLAYGEDSPVLKNKQVRCDMRSSCAWVALGAPCTMQAGTGLANGEGSPVLGSNQVQMGYGWRLGSCASQQARGVNRPALLKRRHLLRRCMPLLPLHLQVAMLQSLSGTGSCRCVLRACVRPLLLAPVFLPTCLYARQWKSDAGRCLHSSHPALPCHFLQAVGRVPGPLAAGLHHLHPHPHLVRAAYPDSGCCCGSDTCCGHALPLPWPPQLPALQLTTRRWH